MANAATTAAMAAAGNQFGAVWTGNITVGGASAFPAGFVSFGTGSDDGSAIYVDVNLDGIFEPSELVVNNAQPHGVVTAIGTVNLAAGTYPVYIGYYESSGGGSMEAKVAAGGAAGPPIAYATQADINPTAAGQAGVWSATTGINNTVTMSGTGTVTLDGNNTYNGNTNVTSGTLVVNNVGALGLTTGPTNVSGTGSLAIAAGLTLTGEPLNLSGAGTGSTLTGGALSTFGGSASYSGPISASGAFTIGAGTGNTLTVGGTIDLKSFGGTLAGTGNTIVNSTIMSSTPTRPIPSARPAPARPRSPARTATSASPA